jgi:hypothetical protein
MWLRVGEYVNCNYPIKDTLGLEFKVINLDRYQIRNIHFLSV